MGQQYQSVQEKTSTEAAQVQAPVRYCLYSRKSTEQDELQALSIESQVKEMMAIADRDGLMVVEIRRESHSAKASGQRPEFNRLIDDLRLGKFDGIIAWAPDRLSRNAGDLGTIVDLMDQGVIKEIRTNGSRFTNSPSEKFMLMMLCSQAKLENDNKSVNVKRGLRAKMEMGYRPNLSPLGYLHDKTAEQGKRRIYLDPVRAPLIKQGFEKVAYQCWTGRRLKKWWDDEVGLRTRSDKKVAISAVYKILVNPFYTGRFEFPGGSGKWYTGKHEVIVPQELFDRVQENLHKISKGIYQSKDFEYTRIFSCGECGKGITAEEKIRRRPDGTIRRYVYYHCTQHSGGCRESYLREEELVAQLLNIIERVSIDELGTVEIVKSELAKMRRLLSLVSKIDIGSDMVQKIQKIDVHACAKMILEEGSREDKHALLNQLKSKIIIKNRKLMLSKSKS